MKQHFLASRNNTITNIEVVQVNPESVEQSRQGKNRKWMVVVHWKSGLTQDDFHQIYFEGEAEAREAASCYRVGSSAPVAWSLNRLDYLAFGRELTLICWGILIEAGLFRQQDQAIRVNEGTVSKRVLEHLGVERLSEIRSEFDRHWEIAALREYCLVNLPVNSPAQIAAECLYQSNVEGDSFAAGYLLRDLEFAVGRVEQSVAENSDRKRSAGAAGARASRQKRLQRVTDLISRIEDLVAENPFLATISETEVAKMAVRDAVSDLWSQGRGQAAEYLAEVRRGEHGEELRTRYMAIFNP